MRINKFIAAATGMSRRAADREIQEGRVTINGAMAELSERVQEADIVTFEGRRLTAPAQNQTILLNKPVGYIVSRDGQGGRTVYDLLPAELHRLKPIGRLDKNSSGLLLLTSDGDLANELTHPKHQKVKIYEVELSERLQPLHRQMISDMGIQLEDGLSQLELERMHDDDDYHWRICMHEGRNRQIRRTFKALGYQVKQLHRTHFGAYMLEELQTGAYKVI